MKTVVYVLYKKGDHIPFHIAEKAEDINDILHHLKTSEGYCKDDWVLEIKSY